MLLVSVALVAALRGYLAREREVRWLRSELGMANDRLYAAWNDGAKIPPRPEPAGDPVSDAPLPPELERFVQRYASDEGKAAARSQVFSMRARGMTDDGIWMELQRRYNL